MNCYNIDNFIIEIRKKLNPPQVIMWMKTTIPTTWWMKITIPTTRWMKITIPTMWWVKVTIPTPYGG